MTRLAVLIDADNAQAALIKELLDEVARYGHGDGEAGLMVRTTSNLRSWKTELHRHAIQLVPAVLLYGRKMASVRR